MQYFQRAGNMSVKMLILTFRMKNIFLYNESVKLNKSG
jgi:hypothetical protein